jgi:hypothetical protein
VHGLTLDRLFREINVDRLTLLDSDAEVKNADVTKRMRAAFDDETVYGAGFVHPSAWLAPEQTSLVVEGATAPVMYAERPWIPFATFRTSYVRAALANGMTFAEVFHMGLEGNLVVDPTELGNRRPAVTHGDTGAQIHGWMNSAGLRFDGPSVADAWSDVGHYHGVSRHALTGNAGNATPLDTIENEVLERLRSAYGDYWNGFAATVQAMQQ